ncbi:MAG: LytTR family DNA-binding domain-containing protein [Bacteroidales bacterium]
MYENKKVLIVDDEEKARLYLASLLSELYPELEIQLVSTPSEALFLLRKQIFHVILLDVEMPGMTGLEMLETLRQQLNQTPVVFVSAYKRAEFIQKALRLAAVDYIDKPVDPAELDKAIKKVFQFKDNIINKIQSVEIENKLCLLTDSGEIFVEPNEIIYFKTAKRYSIICLTDESNKIVRYNLTQLNKLLSSNQFEHVSRQYIVNIKYIKSASKTNKTLTLCCGKNTYLLDKIFPSILSELINRYSLK